MKIYGFSVETHHELCCEKERQTNQINRSNKFKFSDSEYKRCRFAESDFRLQNALERKNESPSRYKQSCVTHLYPPHSVWWLCYIRPHIISRWQISHAFKQQNNKKKDILLTQEQVCNLKVQQHYWLQVTIWL